MEPRTRYRAVYGRRAPRRQEELARQIFGESSSPSHSEEVDKKHATWESLTNNMNELNLGGKERRPISRRKTERKDRAPAAEVLEEMSVNEMIQPRPMIKKTHCKSTTPEVCFSLTVIEQEDSAIALDGPCSPKLRRSPRRKCAPEPPHPHPPSPSSPDDPGILPQTGKTSSPTRSRSRRTTRSVRRVRPEPAQLLSPTINPDMAPLQTYCAPLLHLSSTTNLTSFQSWSDQLAPHFHIRKIAEASYGEVYRLSLRQYHPDFTASDESVLKVIALKPPSPKETKRTAAMSSIPSVTSEVRLLKHMSAVPGFTNHRALHILYGRVPTPFVAAWRAFDRTVKRSEFADPGLKRSYGDDQLWAVVEMQDAGLDLETVAVGSPWVAWDVFWGVAAALAKGHEWTGFEHRDLHLGNICIRDREQHLKSTGSGEGGVDDGVDERKERLCVALSAVPEATIKGGKKLGFTGIETTIIDYTLSRADLGTAGTKAEEGEGNSLEILQSEREDEVAFMDLSQDLSIFEGDATDEYQYEIYRIMRAAVVCGDPQASTQDIEKRFPKKQGGRGRGRSKKAIDIDLKDTTITETDLWRQAAPVTNLIWLHYLLRQLMQQLTVPLSTPVVIADSEAEEEAEEGGLVRAAQALTLDGDESDDVAASRSLLTTRLHELQELLDLQRLKGSGLTSAATLITWAVGHGWLDEDDVLGRDAGADADIYASPTKKVTEILK